MGFWKQLLFLAGGRAPAELKGFTQPPFWAPEHPLQQVWGGGSLPNRETIENDFEGYVQSAFKRNGPIAACIVARQMLFSQAKFKVRTRATEDDGRSGDLKGHAALALLEKPWPNGTTGELLARMEQDVSLAGNSYWTVMDDQLVHLRPDWVSIAIGVPGDADASPNDLRARVIGYWYEPRNQFGGRGDEQSVFLLPEQVAHYSPIPDPVAKYRGMSWITPILREVEADTASTLHKKAFLENAAVPNMAIKFDKDTSRDAFVEFVETFKATHQGAWNAYKTMFLMGGADVTPLTVDFKQMDFSATVGKGESRIAAMAGVPSSWVGFSEGMQGSSLNAGNFAAGRRRLADGTIRPLWEIATASLAPLVKLPDDLELWWDETGIAFLREDTKDQAEIFRTDMIAIDMGIKAGFEADAVVEASLTRDIRRLLGKHTGLVSVQMQEPGAAEEEAAKETEEAPAPAADEDDKPGGEDA